MYSEWTKDDWAKFENLVAAYHATIPENLYEVEQNVILTGPTGGTHQVDVLLKPKGLYQASIIVSCKFEKHKIGPEHIRAWVTVVNETGAARGIIVSKEGFTKDAKDIARNPANRLELWRMKELTEKDFDGYIQKININATLREPFIPEETIELKCHALRQEDQKARVPLRFALASRDIWYLRGDQDQIKENLWDEFVKYYYKNVSLDVDVMECTIRFDEERFFVYDGIKFKFEYFSFVIHHRHHSWTIDFDALEHFNLQYENILTGSAGLVPIELVNFAERE